MPRDACLHVEAFTVHVLECKQCLVAIEANSPPALLCEDGRAFMTIGRGCVECMAKVQKEKARCAN